MRPLILRSELSTVKSIRLFKKLLVFNNERRLLENIEDVQRGFFRQGAY